MEAHAPEFRQNYNTYRFTASTELYLVSDKVYIRYQTTTERKRIGQKRNCGGLWVN